MRHPNIFVAGFPKCGTTTLHEMLTTHPEIVGTAVKEPALYSSRKNYDLGHAYVQAIMPRSRARRVLDATPWYAIVPSALDRMMRHVDQDELRVILLVRDPVDRAYSMYWDQVSIGRETRLPREALLSEGADRPPLDQDDAPQRYVWGSRFDLHIDRMKGAIGSERLIVLATEDLTPRRLPVAWRRISSFLELPDSTAPAPRRANAGTMSRPLPVQLLHGKTGGMLRPIANLLPHRLRVSTGEKIAALGWAKAGAEYPEMKPELRHELEEALSSAVDIHRKIIDL